VRLYPIPGVTAAVKMRTNSSKDQICDSRSNLRYLNKLLETTGRLKGMKSVGINVIHLHQKISVCLDEFNFKIPFWNTVWSLTS
jgi:hypothetical protein